MGRPIRVHLLRYHIVLEIEFRAEQRERLFGLEVALWVTEYVPWSSSTSMGSSGEEPLPPEGC